MSRRLPLPLALVLLAVLLVAVLLAVLLPTEDAKAPEALTPETAAV